MKVSTLPSLLVALALLGHVQGNDDDVDLLIEPNIGECIPVKKDGDDGGCADLDDSKECGAKDGCRWFVSNECQARQPLSNNSMADRVCAFPFMYDGKVHNACTWAGWDLDHPDSEINKINFEPWCALKPEEGSEISWDQGDVFDYESLSAQNKEWGYCGETCPQELAGHECGVHAVVLGGDMKVSETDPKVNTQTCSNFGDWNPGLSPCRTCACTKTLEADQDEVWAEKFVDMDYNEITARRILEHGGKKGDEVCTQPRWEAHEDVEGAYVLDADDQADLATWTGNKHWYSTMSIEEPSSCDAATDDGDSSKCAKKIERVPFGQQRRACENGGGCTFTPGSGGCGRHSTVDSCEADSNNLCFWSPVCLKTPKNRTAGSCYGKTDKNGDYVDNETCGVYRNDKINCEKNRNCKWVDPGKDKRRRLSTATEEDDAGGRGATFQLCDAKTDDGAPCYDRWCTTAEINKFGETGNTGHCKIPYQISRNFGSLPLQDGPRHDDIRASLEHIVQATMQDGKKCLEFNDVGLTNVPDKYLKFSNESWPPCASEIGKSMKKRNKVGQIVYLDGSSTKHCFKKFGQAPYPGNVVHEILHSLGLLHEHSRKDRDDHIQVQCLPKSKQSTSGKSNLTNNMFYTHEYACNNNINFAVNKAEIQLTPYDCDSIMHYGCDLNYKDTYAMWNVCAGDKCQTCSVEGSWPGLGQRETMSPFDIWSIQEMYCPHFHNESTNVKKNDVGQRQPDPSWLWPDMSKLEQERHFLSSRPGTGGYFIQWSTQKKCDSSTFVETTNYKSCNEKNGKCTRGACSPANCGKYCEITAPRANTCTMAIEQTSIWEKPGFEGVYSAEVKSQECTCPADYLRYDSMEYDFNARVCKHRMCAPIYKCFQCLQIDPPASTCSGAQCDGGTQGWKCQGDTWGANCPAGHVGSISFFCNKGQTERTNTCKKATAQPQPPTTKDPRTGQPKLTNQPPMPEAANRSACAADKGLRVNRKFKRCDQLWGPNGNPRLGTTKHKLCNHKSHAGIIRAACPTTCCALQGSMHGADTTIYFEPTEDEKQTTKMESKASTGDAAGLNPEISGLDVVSIYDEAGRCTEDGDRCEFPFIYRGAEWNACLPWEGTYWCSKTDNYDRDRKWGNCARCITKEKWQNVLASMKSDNQSLISELGAEKLAQVFDSALDNFALAYDIAKDILS